MGHALQPEARIVMAGIISVIKFRYAVRDAPTLALLLSCHSLPKATCRLPIAFVNTRCIHDRSLLRTRA